MAESPRLGTAAGLSVVPPRITGKAPEHKRSIRWVCVRQADDGQWYFRVEDRKREPLYTSETYPQKQVAIRRAKREHSSSEDFNYVLIYPDKDGNEVRETLN